MKYLFIAIQGSSCVTSPARFMSDNVDNYLNCAWHIDRIWIKALAETVRQRRTKKVLPTCTLLNEKEKAKCRITLKRFLTYIQKSTLIFKPNLILCLFHHSIGVN